jgi:hypothetical protein
MQPPRAGVRLKSSVASRRTSVLRRWSVDDGRWYVDQLGEAEIQRFTTEPDVLYAQLSIHADNAASIRVSAAAGFVRDPARDKVILVRGEQWPMHAYVRRLRIAKG